MEFLNYTAIPFFLFFEEPPHYFPQCLYHFAFPPTEEKGHNFSKPCQFLNFVSLIIAIQTGVRYYLSYLSVVLIGTFLMTSDVQQLSIPTGHVYFWFEEISIDVFSPF